MAGRAEELFKALNSSEAVLALIGTSEDTHLDCKEWPSREDDVQKMLAKAVCGMANADGGVLVIGMKATGRKDEPDLITGAAPIEDTAAVASRVLNVVPQIVEPGVAGLEVTPIAEKEGSESGFVVVLVPRNEGPPHRSRKEWKFFQRIGSSVLGMDYWQIEERFRLRANPKLELFLEERHVGRSGMQSKLHRHFIIGLRNVGLGLARFPALRFTTDCGLSVADFGLDGQGGFGVPKGASEYKWGLFQGGVDQRHLPRKPTCHFDAGSGPDQADTRGTGPKP